MFGLKKKKMKYSKWKEGYIKKMERIKKRKKWRRGTASLLCEVRMAPSLFSAHHPSALPQLPLAVKLLQMLLPLRY